jgi:hypothetical protein
VLKKPDSDLCLSVRQLSQQPIGRLETMKIDQEETKSTKIIPALSSFLHGRFSEERK